MKNKGEKMKLFVLIILMATGCATVNFYGYPDKEGVCFRSNEPVEIQELPKLDKPLFWKESPHTAGWDEDCGNLINEARCF